MRPFVLCLVVMLAGCLGPSTTTCSDGTTCPAATMCAPAGGACVDPDLVAACAGHDPGASCTADGIAAGAICADQVCSATAWTASVVVGIDTQPTAIGLSGPGGVAADGAGNLYVADTQHHQIRRIDATGAITTLAGTGSPGGFGDGGPATSAELSQPLGVAVDGLGDVYIADSGNNEIRRVDAASGIITTVAGGPLNTGEGDGGPAVDAVLDLPVGVAVDGQGGLYIAEQDAHRIRFVDSNGQIVTFTGTGVSGTPTEGQGAEGAAIGLPYGVAVDAANNLYFTDSNNETVYEVTVADGLIRTIAGMPRDSGSGGDGGPATSATLSMPSGIAVDVAGDVYVADRHNNRIRKIASGVITTVAGDGTAGASGDGGDPVAARLDMPNGVAVDGSGDVEIADTNNDRVRLLAAGTITTIVGNGTATSTGDAATTIALAVPGSVAVDAAGDLVIADTSNNRILQVDPAGLITSIAGTGTTGATGDGGPAIAAALAGPRSVALDAAGNVYIADTGNNRIRRVDRATGMITTIAGTGVPSFAGDGGPATAAELDFPEGVALDGAGNVYVADADNDRIRRIAATTGVITTVAGTGAPSESGDGGPAISANLDLPFGVAVDHAGTLYIADFSGSRVRAVDPSGMITTLAGNGLPGFGGDDGAATAAQLSGPQGIAVDGSGAVYIADTGNSRIRRVDPAGIITTVAGSVTGLDGDGGPAINALIEAPGGVAVDAGGALYVADAGNGRIRRVDVAGVITTVAGAVDPPGMGALAVARFADPRAIVVAPAFTLVAGGATGTVQALRTGATSLGVVIGRDANQRDPTGSLARFQGKSFGTVSGIALDPAAELLYLTESTTHLIDVVTLVDPADQATWTIATLASSFRDPTGLYLDAAAQVLYVADTGNHVIRSIAIASGDTAVVAGTPETLGLFGDHGPATSALLFAPQAITKCGNGDLFIADTGNSRVRRIASGSGVITTVLGDGSPSSSGDGAPATDFPVDDPLDLACDAAGNLFVTSTATVRMLIADPAGVIDGTGPVRTIYGAQPRDALPASVTRCLTGLAVIDPATVQVVDSCTGILVTLARTTP